MKKSKPKEFPGDFWFKFPQGLKNKLMCFKLSNSKMRVLFAILDKTYNWKKYKAKITQTELCEITVIERSNMFNTIKLLLNNRIILRENGFYSINTNYDQWKESVSKSTTKRCRDQQQSVSKSTTFTVIEVEKKQGVG